MSRKRLYKAQSMSFENYFPKGVAKGEAFCNRVIERARLAKNIKTGQHTLVVSPRRYGKTSLVSFVINETKTPYGKADLFVAIDAKRIEQSILAGVKMVFSGVSSSLDQSVKYLSDYFKKSSPQWTIGSRGINLALIPDKNSDSATSIMEALLALEGFLAKKKKRAVLFLDEVQEISKIAEGKGIEGAIRHAAQETKYLSIIFSGSSRHLLKQMFFSKSRPLYKLCDKITLDHISEEDYRKHLDKIAHLRWNKPLAEQSLLAIFKNTERYTYYINNLCLRLWNSELSSAPSPDDIDEHWRNCVEDEKQEIIQELTSLSAGQRKILLLMAKGETKSLTGKNFLGKINMSGPAVHEALQILEEKDYIERIGDRYAIIDPLIKTALNLYFE